MNPFPLGAFEVSDKIAEGGMGDVWRGVHVAQGVPVAIKVLRPSPTQDAKFRAAFRREVRAIARLDHPAIITIFDSGEVSRATAAASRGAMAADSPYLVMEYLERGSLDAVAGPLAWERLREALLGVLDGLAHAHARGLMHLDIKPGNVLLAGKPPGFPVRVTDFGLAFSRRETGPSEDQNVAGTPLYMAPEQFFGEWRDFGPWTDLYALGCVAYQLASGRAPFESGGLVGVATAHIQEQPTAFDLPPDFPRGFLDWVMRLLEKAPAERYRRCAAAAAALAALTADGAPEPAIAPAASGGAAIARAKELERAWRGPAPPPRPFQLIGAGLRLYGLRTVPMVGREAERELLWRAFERTVEGRHGRVVVIEGAAGVGKTRLASWFCERLHELDVADCLMADRRGSGQREAGLSFMLARAWACLHLGGAELRKRVGERLSQAGIASPERHDALTELLAPAALGSDYEPGMFHAFPSRAARFQTLQEILRDAYAGRPVVIWVDDAHADADALAFAHSIPAAEFPIMAVVTVRDDLLVEAPRAADRLRDLSGHERTERLRLGPLSEREGTRLVRSLLHLDGDLAAAVAARAGGNPLYATQLVGDWVARGTLHAGARGFVLTTPELPPIPDDLQALWAQRLERVLDDRAGDEAGSVAGPVPRMEREIALELAAALGGDVDMAEWRAVCARAGVATADPVLERLLAFRMARGDADGWSFSHGMLRDTLKAAARERGRWAGHNRHCADMLEERRPVPHWGDSERIGRHRFEAAQVADAVGPLLRGAAERKRAEEYSAALELIALHHRALATLDASTDDPRQLEGWLAAAEIRWLRGELTEAEGLASRVASVPARAETARFHGSANLMLARVQHRRGRASAALSTYRDAARALRAAGAVAQLGRCLAEQAEVMLELDLVAPAWDSLHEAQRIFEAAGQLVPWAESQLGMARVVSRLGHREQSVALCRRVLAFARRDGLGRLEASARFALADVQLEQGDPAGAEASLASGIRLFEQLGLVRRALRARVSRIVLFMQSGKWDRAEAEADELAGVPEIEVSGVARLLLCCVRVALAAGGSPAALERHVDRATALLADVERTTPDMDRCLRLAVARAEGGGAARDAERVRALRDLVAARLPDGAPPEAAHESG